MKLFNKWFFVLVGLFVTGFFIVAIVKAVSPDGNLSKNAAMGLQDTTPVGWINERVITRGALTGLANTYMDLGEVNQTAAYQKALNLLVQNSLFLQEATRRGLLPTAQEVETRVNDLLQAARKDNPQLREMYIAQATALGTTWDSPEFAAYLKATHREAMPAEKLNQQLLAEVNGDEQQFNQVKVELLTELMSTATIRLDTATLPEEAKDIQEPLLADLPLVKEGK